MPPLAVWLCKINRLEPDSAVPHVFYRTIHFWLRTWSHCKVFNVFSLFLFRFYLRYTRLFIYPLALTTSWILFLLLLASSFIETAQRDSHAVITWATTMIAFIISPAFRILAKLILVLRNDCSLYHLIHDGNVTNTISCRSSRSHRVRWLSHDSNFS